MKASLKMDFFTALMTTLSLLMVTPVATLPCPRPCSCPQPTELHCTFRSLIAVPVGISKQVERMNLGFNTMTKLTERSLADLRKLELLMVHGNNIHSISHGAFRDLIALQMLKMSYNKLTEITRETLWGLWSLARLHLDHNRLEFIHPDSFQGLTSLRLLQLEGNRLQQLHPATFATFSLAGHFHLSTLRHLYLSENGLTSLPAGMVEGMPQLENLYLHGNPWCCDCHMRWFPDWERNSPGVVKCKKDRAYPGGQLCPMCSSPKHLRMKELQGLQAHLRCSPPFILAPHRAAPTEDEERTDSEVMTPEDFREPLGNVTLGLSDEHGNKVDLECGASEVRGYGGGGGVPTVRAAWEQLDPLRLAANASIHVDLDCPMEREEYERLWRLVAYYSDAPAHLQRESLLSKEPWGLSYRYRQDAARDALYYTGVRASVAARPAWLMQTSLDLRLNRAQSTGKSVRLVLGTWLAQTVEAERERRASRPWVFIQATNATRTAVTAVVGGDAHLDCNVRSSGDAAVRWTLPDGSRLEAPFGGPDRRVSVLSGGQLVVREVGHSDAGVYYCVATVAGDAGALPFRLTVEESSSPPPGGDGAPAPVEGYTGDAVTLPCATSGSPDAEVTWVLPDGDTAGFRGNGSRARVYANGTLWVAQAQLSDGGYYKCVAANQHGADSVSTKVTLTRRAGLPPQRKYPARPQSAAGVNTKIKVPTEENAKIKVPVEDVEESSGDDDDGRDKASPGRVDLLTRRRGPATGTRGGHPSRNTWRRPSVQQRPFTAGSRVPDGRKNMLQTRRRINVANNKIDPEKWADIMAKMRDRGGVTVAQPTPENSTTTTAAAASETPDNTEGSSGDTAPEETATPHTTVTERTTVRHTQPDPDPHTGSHSASYTVTTDAVTTDTVTTDTVTTDTVTTDTVTTNTASRLATPTQPTSVPQQRRGNAVVTDPGLYDGPWRGDQSPAPDGGSPAALDVAPTLNEGGEDGKGPAVPVDTAGNELAPDGRRRNPFLTTTDTYSAPSTDENDSLFADTLAPTTHGPLQYATLDIPATLTTTSPATTPTLAVSLRKEVVAQGGSRLRNPNSRRRNGERRRRPNGRKQRPNLARELTTATPMDALPETTMATAATLPKIETRGEASAAASAKSDGAVPFTESQASSWARLRHNESPVWVRGDGADAAASPSLGASASLSQTKNSSPPPDKPPVTSASTDPSFSTASRETGGARGKASSEGDSRRAESPTATGPRAPTSVRLSAGNPSGEKPRAGARGGTRPVPSADESRESPSPSGAQPNVEATQLSRRHGPGAQARDVPLVELNGKLPPPSPPSSSSSSSSSLPSSSSMQSPSEEGPRVPSTSTEGAVYEADSETSRVTAATSRPTYLAPDQTVGMNSGGAREGRKERVSHGGNVAVDIPNTVSDANEAPTVTAASPRLSSGHPDLPLPTEGRGRPLEGPNHIPDSHGERSHRLDQGNRGNPVSPRGNADVIRPQPRGDSVPPTQGTGLGLTFDPPTSGAPATSSRGVKKSTTTTTRTVPSVWGGHSPRAPQLPSLAPPRGHGPSREGPGTGPQPQAPAVVTRLQSGGGGGGGGGGAAAAAGGGGGGVGAGGGGGGGGAAAAAAAGGGGGGGAAAAGGGGGRGAAVGAGGGGGGAVAAVGGGGGGAAGGGGGRGAAVGAGGGGGAAAAAGGGGGAAAVGAGGRGGGGSVAGSIPRGKPRILNREVQTVSVKAETDARLPCETEGEPTPFLSWTKVSTGASVAQNTRVQRFEVHSNGTLIIRNTQPLDRGQYLCMVQNQYGADRTVVNLVVLSQHPRMLQPRYRDLSVHLGDTIDLDCQAQGQPAPRITWVLPNRVHMASSASTAPAAPPQRLTLLTNGTLRIRQAGYSDRGVYRCMGSSVAGADSVSVRLQVSALPPTVLQPRWENATLPEGGTAYLPCSARGAPPPILRWTTPDGHTLLPSQFVQGRNLLVFPNGTLTVRGLGGGDAGAYECLASNAVGAARRTVVLAVLRAPSATKARIASSSAGQETDVVYGAKLQLDCLATGEPEPRILWRTPSKKLVDAQYSFDSRIKVFSNGTLTVQAVTNDDGGDYLCVARNKMGDDYVLLRVNVLTKPAKIQHKQPLGNQEVMYGGDLKVDCIASGSPDPEITWALPDGTMVNPAKPAEGRSVGSGAVVGGRSRRYVVFHNGTLYLNEVGMREQGDYTCYAENRLGRDQMKVRVKVVAEPPRIRDQSPEVVSVLYGETVSLGCSAKGEPSPVYSWVSPTNRAISSSSSSSSSSDKHQVLSDGTLVIRKAQRYDGGNYTCTARNSAGQDRKVTRLDVLVTPPTINGLRGVSNVLGAAAIRERRKLLDCVATGTPPPRVMWVLPENVILPAPYRGSRMTVHPNGTLDIRAAKPADAAGPLVCVARNEGGEATLTVRLEVHEAEERPQVRGPKAESRRLTAGSAMTLDCSFQGAARPQVTWILPDGTPLASGAHVSRFSHWPNGSLVISNPSVSDVGMYRCLGRSAGGLAERTITLAPGRQPEIGNRYNSPVSVTNGETLLLHCLSSGEPVRLTWTLPSGVVLARPQRAGRYAVLANGTLAILQASVYDRGAYACRAANEYGSALLSVAVVVVAYPPRITSGPPAVTYARRGVAVQLNCLTTGVPKAEVVWETPERSRLAVSALPRLYGNRYLHPQGSLIIQNPTQRDVGYYRCTARNVVGVDAKATYLNVF